MFIMEDTGNNRDITAKGTDAVTMVQVDRVNDQDSSLSGSIGSERIKVTT